MWDISSREGGELTRIMVRRRATDPKTGFAGVVLVASLAMFRPSMAIFNAGMTLPRPSCRWGLSVMVEIQGECEEVVGENPSGGKHGRPSRRASHRFDQFGGENTSIRTATTAIWDGIFFAPFTASRSRVLERWFAWRLLVRWLVDVRDPPYSRFVPGYCHIGSASMSDPPNPWGNWGLRLTLADFTEDPRLRILAVRMLVSSRGTRNPIFTPRNTRGEHDLVGPHASAGGHYYSDRVSNDNDSVCSPRSLWLLPIVEPVLPHLSLPGCPRV